MKKHQKLLLDFCHSSAAAASCYFDVVMLSSESFVRYAHNTSGGFTSNAWLSGSAPYLVKGNADLYSLAWCLRQTTILRKKIIPTLLKKPTSASDYNLTLNRTFEDNAHSYRVSIALTVFLQLVH